MVVVIAALFVPLAARGQVLTPSRPPVDTIVRPLPAPLPMLSARSGVRVCMDCHGWELRPGTEPAFIIKDSASHVLAMVPPGDSLFFRDPLHSLGEANTIAAVEVRRDTSLVRVLGPGFENGLVIITLTPAGTVRWRSLGR